MSTLRPGPDSTSKSRSGSLLVNLVLLCAFICWEGAHCRSLGGGELSVDQKTGEKNLQCATRCRLIIESVARVKCETQCSKRRLRRKRCLRKVRNIAETSTAAITPTNIDRRHLHRLFREAAFKDGIASDYSFFDERSSSSDVPADSCQDINVPLVNRTILAEGEEMLNPSWLRGSLRVGQCPFTEVVDRAENRIPVNLRRKQCLCDRSECNTSDRRYKCTAVTKKIQVFTLDYSSLQYQRSLVDVPIDCVCAMEPRSRHTLQHIAQ